MARVLEQMPRARSAAPADDAAAPVPAGFRGRALERNLLFWNALLLPLAAWGVAAAQRHPAETFLPALTGIGVVWAACLLLHLLFCAIRFDGDLLLLPLLSVLLIVGAAYHLDLRGPGQAGLTPGAYDKGVLLAMGVLAVVTAGGPWFKRLNLLIEEKIWWRVAGDRPYYESVPFHAVLLLVMFLLAGLLAIHGIRSEGGALIQVPLPGGIRFTPSELIRLAVAFFLADYLGRHSRVLRNLRQPLGRVWPLNRMYVEPRTELTVVLTTVGLYCLFFYIFHDFGPAAVIIALTLAALVAATGRWFTALLLGLGIGVAIAIPTLKDVGFHTLHNRMEMWFDPWNTRFVHGDHQARILWAIASGGWTGLGPGTVDLPRILPLAQNDAAFAGVAATLGLWTGLAVLAVFVGITWRGMVAARQAATDRMRLLGFCLTTLLALQAVWICGAMVRAFPFTGINLPFVSTGMSNMVTSAIALGTIWNISRLRSARPDASDATPELLRGVTRLAVPVTAAFALPAVGLALYGCPWLLGDRTLVQVERTVGRGGDRYTFGNPLLEGFKKRFPRGAIYSADGKVLAVSNPTPTQLEDIRRQSPAFAAKVERAERGGPTGDRYYPLGAGAAQLVGWSPQGRFTTLDGSVETAWDTMLRGYRPEQLPFFWRTRNNPLIRPPQPQDLQLTVEADLQQWASGRLAQAVRTWGGTGGALVVYDVAKGDVLAAATAPSFDPNGLTLEQMQRYVAEDPRTQILSNKALSKNALYFPGSTFKVLTAAAALDQHITGTVDCRRGVNAAPLTWSYGGKRWRKEAGKIADFSHEGHRTGHGKLSLSADLDRALAVSCNVFFAKLATEIGAEHFHETLTAAELAHAPDVKSLAEYLPFAGFGQIVVKASPLEMAQIAGAAGAAREDNPEAPAARPSWVQAVVQHGTKRQPEGFAGAPNTKPYRPFSAHVAQQLRRLMIGVVESPSGTAHGAFFRGGGRLLPGITVGGKTGTAEYERGKRGGIGRHAWFIGFARSDWEQQPRTIAFAVLVEGVRKGGTGGTVCAPVARDLVQRILPLQGGNPQPNNLFSGLERFYQERIRPGFGPLGPLADWLRGLVHR